MFIGKGFDTDGDGTTDVFVGGKATPEQVGYAGCGFLAVGGIVLATILVAASLEWIQKPRNWPMVVWGGWIFGALLLASLLSVFMKPPLAWVMTAIMIGGWFGLGWLSTATGVSVWLVAPVLLGGLCLVAVTLLVAFSQAK
jgi:hypothetical protein